MNWGLFVQTIINFIIIGFVLFIIITIFEKFLFKKKADETKKCESCMEKIHLLANRCKFCTTIINEPTLQDNGLTERKMLVRDSSAEAFN